MSKYTKIPPITGKKLLKLLNAEGWAERRRTRHGIAMVKEFGGITRITIIKNSSAIIPDGTLGDILGAKQTGIGKKGLLELINKYGI